ncbi:MAG: peptidase domain-containing ABC transporter [Scytonematopsis contorta HA4267-MV1]|jgi:ATP-binding cassette subfamily C protein|nr:peptidase domain-containing ABC transporter [Scytonematopsis contorta HA4267-MV1]
MKYQFIRQHSEQDCGAACLAAISKYYGKNFTLNRTREVVGTGQLGTTLLGLRRGAETLGFNARAVKASSDILDKINQVPLPAIIHWMGYHWVILYGRKGKKAVVADPAIGIRFLSKKELAMGWTDGVMLLLEKDASRFLKQPEDKTAGVGRFFQRVLPYSGILLEVFICALVTGLLSLASPFLVQILTDDVLVRGDMRLLNVVAIAVVVMNMVSSSLALVQSNLVAHFAQRLELGLVLEFARAILHLPLSYYESRRSGEIVSRQRDIQEINQIVSQVVVSLPSQIFIAVISFAFMLTSSWRLTLAAVVIAVFMSISTVVFLPTLQQKTRSVLVAEAENQGVLVETFKGALTLKTTTSTPQFWEEFQTRFTTLANLTFRTVQIGIINNIFSGLVSGIGSVGLLWFGSSLVINKELSIGQLLAFNSMNGNFIALIATLVGLMDELTRAKTATERLTEVIDSTPESEDDSQKSSAPIADDGDIVCTKVNFNHAGRLDLLDDFTLTIPGGKVTALIGKSGCGKSTLSKVVTGLYPIQSGTIYFGIYNLQDLRLDSLRQQVVLVPQDAHFWSRSILDNFRLAVPDATFEDIVIACKVAGADEFIRKLPNTYQTVLGEFGANISGGQRQRLALARALVNNPPIMILDESTSGLDPVSEEQVLDQVLSYREGKTTILISHRPRVITRADWVVFLEQGKLKLQGSVGDLRCREGEHLRFLIP